MRKNSQGSSGFNISRDLICCNKLGYPILQPCCKCVHSRGYESPERALGHVVLGEHEVLTPFIFPGFEKCGGHANLGLLVAAQNRPFLFQLKLGQKSEPHQASRMYLQNRATNC